MLRSCIPSPRVGRRVASLVMVAASLIFGGLSSTLAADDRSGIWVDGKAQAGGDGSYEKPYRTIAEAVLQSARPNDVENRITIRGGTYLETVVLDGKYKNGKSGSPEQPFVLRGMPGERVVVSGMKRVTGWKKDSGQVYVADLGEWNPAAPLPPNTFPETFYFDMQEKPMAQSPQGEAQPWVWKSMTKDAAGNLVISDPEHLQGVGDLTGGYIQYFSIPYQISGAMILSNDPGAGTLTVGGNTAVMETANYIIKNARQLITQPGEWAFVKQAEGKYKLYYWPSSEAEAASLLSANPLTQARNGNNRVVAVFSLHDVVVANLEIMGASGAGDGVYVGDSQNVTVRNCVIHDNGGYLWQNGKSAAIRGSGIALRNVDGATVTNNLITLNYNGIGIRSCKDVTVSHNDIGYNYIDGFDISSGNNLQTPTLNVTISNNYIHHHYNLLQHPDALQTYESGVQGLKVVDNVILGSPQIMHNGMAGGEYSGNVIWGPQINSLGRLDKLAAVGPVTFNNNTMYGGVTFYGTMPMSVTENVFLGRVITYAESYKGDRNLIQPMLASPGVYDKAQIISINEAKQWRSFGVESGGGLQGFFDLTGQDEHSQIAPAGQPLFVNMPSVIRFLGDIKDEQWSQASSTIPIEKGPYEGSGKKYATMGFSVGGYVEINVDGVPRQITAIDDVNSTITVTPALKNRAHLFRGDIIEYWGNRTDFNRDSRLAENSPGRTMAADGGPIGSRLIIGNYQAGDFDGNGTRDVPALPADVEMNLKNHDFHQSPWFAFGN